MLNLKSDKKIGTNPCPEKVYPVTEIQIRDDSPKSGDPNSSNSNIHCVPKT